MRWLIDILAFLEARFIHKDMATLPTHLKPPVDHSQCRRKLTQASPRVKGVSVRPYNRQERQLLGNPEAQAIRRTLGETKWDV